MLNSSGIIFGGLTKCQKHIYIRLKERTKKGGGLNLRNRVLPTPQKIQSIKIQKDARYIIQITVSW